MADTQQTSEENFVIQTPSEVATTEAGAHTLAGAGAGVELSAADAYGFAGESKSQARLVLNRFFQCIDGTIEKQRQMGVQRIWRQCDDEVAGPGAVRLLLRLT